MPQRPPTLAQRLRSLWSPRSGSFQGARSTSGRHTPAFKGGDFADRLRAAVSARH